MTTTNQTPSNQPDLPQNTKQFKDCRHKREGFPQLFEKWGCGQAWQRSSQFREQIRMKYGRNAFYIHSGVNLAFLGASYALSKTVLSFMSASKIKTLGVFGLTFATFALSSPLRFKTSQVVTPAISNILNLQATENDKIRMVQFAERIKNGERPWPKGFGSRENCKKGKKEQKDNLLAEAGISSAPTTASPSVPATQP